MNGGSRVSKAEAESRVLDEWRAWKEANVPADGTPTAKYEGRLFFGHLERNKHHLLRFNSADDKWQVIKGWLLNAGALTD